MNSVERINEIQKEIRNIAIMDFPASILVGLGLYGKFGSSGNAFHPLLNDQNVVNGMLIIAAAIMIWGSIKIISLLKERAQLKEKAN
jgi:hypothetical protein